MLLLCSFAIARIEDMRREIGASNGASGVDELQLLELMDEGTYGKVFKGEPAEGVWGAAAGLARPGDRQVRLCST